MTKTYDVVSVVYHALQGVENCRTYCHDARDDESRRYFEDAAEMQRQLAERGKNMLRQCLQTSGPQAGDGQTTSEEGGVSFQPDAQLSEEISDANR